MKDATPKQRMLNAYLGLPNDRPPVAPEFWVYYPAKLLGLDMIAFSREIPFHIALKKTFEHFHCEGWGIACGSLQLPDVRYSRRETWLDQNTILQQDEISTPFGTLTSATRSQRDEPSWIVERPLKDLHRDLKAWEYLSFGDPSSMDVSGIIRAWNEVGDSYLLEAFLGLPFFDFYASAREGGFETAILEFCDPDMERFLLYLRDRYKEWLAERARVLCDRTPCESLFIGCSWSCNSLLGPALWRKWDKPVIQAVSQTVHARGRLLHLHFHGRCMETIADFAEVGLDCVCPFERPPGGDVAGAEGLAAVERQLRGKTTMNGNVHTVATLIRGTEHDVRREVSEILTAFRDNPRLIVGTGDQVGRETPEENLMAMISEVKKFASHKDESAADRNVQNLP